MSSGTAAAAIPPLTRDDRRFLLRAAIEAISARLAGRAVEVDPPASARLHESGACFVTLHRDERLLGCIGSLEPHRPLYVDVLHNAAAAAFSDPRMPALTSDDFAAATLKISVLSPLEALAVRSEAELLSAVRPTVDGLLVADRACRGTFLPSVWRQVPQPRDFLDALWRKAGLAPRSWPVDLQVWRYQTDEFAATRRSC